jgi:inner membrane protein
VLLSKFFFARDFSNTLMMFYGFIYVIPQLQDYSLLIGNIALFVILAAIMFFTRKINWFDVLSNKANVTRVE